MNGISWKVPEVSLAETPTIKETIAAIQRLKKGKASGPDGIEAEILMSLDPTNVRIRHEFHCRIWEGLEELPKEWRASYLVPLPKKGDLTLCKNWRGILLASIPGYKYAEEAGLLPEAQCGFRAGRGVIDAIFCLKMGMELAAYRHHPFYVLFVDLVKAYDSVSRAGVWTILRKKGVPAKFVELVKDYYSGKCTQVSEVSFKTSASGLSLSPSCTMRSASWLR